MTLDLLYSSGNQSLQSLINSQHKWSILKKLKNESYMLNITTENKQRELCLTFPSLLPNYFAIFQVPIW